MNHDITFHLENVVNAGELGRIETDILYEALNKLYSYRNDTFKCIHGNTDCDITDEGCGLCMGGGS